MSPNRKTVLCVRHFVRVCVCCVSLPHYIAIICVPPRLFGALVLPSRVYVYTMYACKFTFKWSAHTLSHCSLLRDLCVVYTQQCAIIIIISYHVKWSRTSSRSLAGSSNPHKAILPAAAAAAAAAVTLRTTHVEPIFHHLSLNGEIIAYCRFGFKL